MLKKILRKTYLIGFLIIIPFSVQALEVGCSVKSMNYTMVSVTGISGEFDANDYSDTGVLQVTAIVSGNGNKVKKTKQFKYKKVGKRLELNGGSMVLGEAKKVEEHLGAFPDVTCTSP